MEEKEIILEVENTSEQTIDILQEEVKEIHPIYEQLDITPSIKKQEYKGSFDKVTVAGDEDLKPENIKEGVNIFGVEGSAKTTSAKITNCDHLFRDNLRIDYMDEILELCDKVTSCFDMFYYCKNLTSLNLSNFDTSNVTTMRGMFENCMSLTSLNLSNFDTSNVTNMQNMFSTCRNLASLNVSNFDTSKVTNMSGMFQTCLKLTSLDLSNFDTSNVTNMYSIFANDEFETIDLSNFDTSNVTNMSQMFYYCSKLTSLDLSNFDTSNVTNMSQMFYYCKNLTSLDLSSFDMSKVTNIKDTFTDCKILANLTFCTNLGKSYTQKSENYSNYTLNLSNVTKLSHESLMSVINNLYDLNLTYDVANGGTLYRQELKLGSTNKAKLTEEEIAIATNKGWNVT